MVAEAVTVVLCVVVVVDLAGSMVVRAVVAVILVLVVEMGRVVVLTVVVMIDEEETVFVVETVTGVSVIQPGDGLDVVSELAGEVVTSTIVHDVHRVIARIRLSNNAFSFLFFMLIHLVHLCSIFARVQGVREQIW